MTSCPVTASWPFWIRLKLLLVVFNWPLITALFTAIAAEVAGSTTISCPNTALHSNSGRRIRSIDIVFMDVIEKRVIDLVNMADKLRERQFTGVKIIDKQIQRVL